MSALDARLVERLIARLYADGRDAYLLRTRILQALIEAAQLVDNHDEARALKRELEQLVLAGGRDTKPDNTNREGR